MKYREITKAIGAEIVKLRNEIPDVTHGFAALSAGAMKEGVLDKKTKELIAMGIAIAARCNGCVGFHAQALHKLGVTREEFLELLGVAIYMGGGPSYMTAAEALMAFEEFNSGQ